MAGASSIVRNAHPPPSDSRPRDCERRVLRARAGRSGRHDRVASRRRARCACALAVGNCTRHSAWQHQGRGSDQAFGTWTRSTRLLELLRQRAPDGRRNRRLLPVRPWARRRSRCSSTIWTLGDVSTGAWTSPGAADWTGLSGRCCSCWRRSRCTWPCARARLGGGGCSAPSLIPAVALGVGLLNADNRHWQLQARTVFAAYTHRFPSGRLHGVYVPQPGQALCHRVRRGGPRQPRPRARRQTLLHRDQPGGQPKGRQVEGGWRYYADVLATSQKPPRGTTPTTSSTASATRSPASASTYAATRWARSPRRRRAPASDSQQRIRHHHGPRIASARAPRQKRLKNGRGTCSASSRPRPVSARKGLAVLRNLAAHGGVNEVGPDRAKDHLALVDAVLFALRASPPPAAAGG